MKEFTDSYGFIVKTEIEKHLTEAWEYMYRDVLAVHNKVLDAYRTGNKAVVQHYFELIMSNSKRCLEFIEYLDQSIYRHQIKVLDSLVHSVHENKLEVLSMLNNLSNKESFEIEFALQCAIDDERESDIIVRRYSN